MAAAAALHLAREHPEIRKYCFFPPIPPTPSRMFLRLPVGNRITPVQWSGVSGQGTGGRGRRTEDGGQAVESNLFALEINPEDALGRVLKRPSRQDVERSF